MSGYMDRRPRYIPFSSKSRIPDIDKPAINDTT